MKNFARVIRLALRYRFSVLASLFCSLMVGVLWGGNIVALYPVVEVVFRGDSFHVWAEQRVASREETCAGSAAEIKNLQNRLRSADPHEQAIWRKKIQVQREQLAGQQSSLVRARWQEQMVKQYLPDDPFLDLALVVAALMIGTVLKSAFLAAHVVLVARIRQLTLFDLRNQFFRETLNMDLASFGQHRTSGLLSRFTHDTNILEQGLGTLFGQAVREPLKMISCLILAAFISWRLLLLSLIITPLGLLLLRWLNRAMKKTSGRSMDVIAEMYARLSESFNGIKAVKSFTMEQYECRRFHNTSREYVKRSMRFTTYLALFKPVSEIMAVAVVSLAILLGAHLVLNEATHVFGLKMSNQPLGPAELMVFFGMLAGMADPARKMSDIYAMLIGGIAAADRVYELMDQKPSISEPLNAKPVARPHSHLRFEQVEFHYRAAEPVLKGVDLEIQFGESIVVLGPNGCGKSTLANLIPRFFDPVRGSVRLDNVDLKEMSLEDVRSRIGLVTQEPLLFDDTVISNIRYGSPDASDFEVIKAAKRAYAHEFVSNQLDEGYQTLIGQGGGWLSGGQRQRVALARAMLRDPEILILDEATSQIDVQSEILIHRALEDFVRGRTTIIISHRLSVLTMADRIVVMDAGRILDCGTHDQLYTRCDLYRQLYESYVREAA